ncbi:MAG: hypothetical protein NTY90_03740 [Candidatus Micrarchaeota archaeon]|nr:hypothetical protein [Candidatus Micrarchaeota archaeon]
MDLITWLQRNRVIVLVGALLVVFLVVGMLSQPPAVQDKESAVDFVLKDALGAYPGAAVNVTKAGNEDGKWKVDVKIVVDAHSPCPKVFIRNYELLPIFFREQQILKNCEVSGNIVSEEEAIVVSAKKGALASKAAAAGALGYVTYFSRAVIDAARNCTSCQSALPAPLAGPLAGAESQNLWVVEWRLANQSVFTALDEKGEVVAEAASG